MILFNQSAMKSQDFKIPRRRSNDCGSKIGGTHFVKLRFSTPGELKLRILKSWISQKLVESAVSRTTLTADSTNVNFVKTRILKSRDFKRLAREISVWNRGISAENQQFEQTIGGLDCYGMGWNGMECYGFRWIFWYSLSVKYLAYLKKAKFIIWICVVDARVAK